MARKSKGPPEPSISLPVFSAYATMPHGRSKYGSGIALLATSQFPLQCLHKAVCQYELYTGYKVASADDQESMSSEVVRYKLLDAEGVTLTRLYIVGRP